MSKCDYNNKRVILVPGTLRKTDVVVVPGNNNGNNVTLPISSDDVLYGGQVLTDVLDDILYIFPDILTFTTNILNYEKGVVLNSLSLTWSINKSIASQTISSSEMDSPLSPSAELRQATVTLSAASSNFSIVLTVVDSKSNQDIANINIKFIEPVYTGVAAVPGAINSAFINNLTKQLIENTAVTKQVTLGSGQYWWYAVPQSRVAGGLPAITINGFPATMTDLGTISHTNSSGHTVSYRILRSEFDNLGLTTFQIS